MKRKLAAILLATSVGIGAVTVPSQAQVFGGGIVFDPTNYAQNLLTAARALQQVNNQILSLQNEANMLLNMGKDLSSLSTSELSTMISGLTGISTLMDEGRGIAFNVEATTAAWKSLYPGSYPVGTATATFATNAQSRWQQAMDAFQQALQVQAQIVQNVQSDSTTLTSLVNASQGAVGNLQATQATNQLLALSTKQQLQLQNLMAAQYRASALEAARNAESEAAAQSEFSTFLGSSRAYTSH
ncbi:P-type conjugative transfer protein TrbJ [Rhizomicrobium palustre]|uniref:P-type conjugative transfer protein TrbJ n=1 Tax=Rhizomicrobium palustre TaxID=189966 RepID=A0A846MWM3_9PROT|nr:P-type conjugative transfer protein TrbJ [Rhizomicrobium palustre]NIK87551.1 P-type conjugative transfer protein TrbJ [Rhizomicrobium palustre]